MFQDEKLYNCTGLFNQREIQTTTLSLEMRGRANLKRSGKIKIQEVYLPELP